MEFHERDNEMQQMKEIQETALNQAQITVVTGRRRSGRTQFVLNATKGRTTLYFFIARKAESLLCHEFVEEVNATLDNPLIGEINDFRTLFKSLMAASKEQPFNLIIDEFQEFNTINQNIFTDLQNIWDRNKDRSRLCLFLLGTDSAQTTRIFEGNHAPLAGRVNNHIVLHPYSSATLKGLLAEASPEYTPKDLLALYTFTGGVPKYVHTLLNAGATTAEGIIDFVCRENSPYLSEGKQLLIEDFGKEYTIYFSILTCIANDITSRSYIEEYIQKEIGGYLTRLETDFHLIKKLTPLFSKSGSKNVRYNIVDNFLRFWFRFIYSNVNLVETGRFDALRKIILADFDNYATQCLKIYHNQLLRESERFSCIGGWWDHRGDNDIDLVALDEEGKQALVAEVSRNSADIDLHALAAKAAVLHDALDGYQIEYKSFGLDEM